MARKRFIFQLLPAFLLITLFSLLLVTYFAARAFESLEFAKTESDLLSQARLFDALITSATRDDVHLQTLCVRLGEETGTRFTVIEPDGRVVADSDEAPDKMDNHATRPEVAAALPDKPGRAVRFSYTTNTPMMYLAVPAEGLSGGRVLRLALPLTTIREILGAFYWRLGLILLAVVCFATLTSWLVARRVLRPLVALKSGAARFAEGDFSTPLQVPDSEEFGGLADALNEMARQCAYRIDAMVQQRNEQDAVFSSMMEGVLAVDPDLRVISTNETAAHLLNIDPVSAKGRPILEVVRNMALHDFARSALESATPVESEISLGQREPLLLKAQGTVLRDGAGRAMGAVIVINDITRLRHLEEVRQDFVANVSHELKTPITSIKGFVETLLDEETFDPVNTRRFLTIIGKQANRLDAIIEDLLSLSRLEQSKGVVDLVVEPAPVLPIIEAAVELCQHQADARGVHLAIRCSDTLRAPLNPPLVEQGLVNLINNAIKYSDTGQTVLIRAHDTADTILIDVIDEGTGIHANEVERIFERFYRIDKARSRDLGGTGLGLSIVKHIAQAHRGAVTVKSTPGEGSTFTLRLPLG